jgi:hypothetical protein
LFLAGVLGAPPNDLDRFDTFIDQTTDPTVPAWSKGVTVRLPLHKESVGNQIVTSDPAVWKFGKDKEGVGFLALDYDRKAYKSSYAPKHRSPVHIALLKQYPMTDFVMDVEMMSTTEEYGHQDLCLFFGVQSPERYYYVHLAPAPDASAHNVFVVNDAPRKNLLPPQKKGITWKKGTWHTVRLVRQATTGKIEVYFDDLTKPVLAANDKTFQAGFVGFGSFDDIGRCRRVTLHTKNLVIDKQADFFTPLGK